MQLKARKRILEAMRDTIRTLTGVTAKDVWPTWEQNMEARVNADTGEEYLTPDFSKGVTAAVNKRLFSQTADCVIQDLNRQITVSEAANRPDWTKDPSFRVTKRDIVDLAKVSFNGYKRQWADEQDEERGRKARRNEQKSRRSLRRETKLKHLQMAVPAYIKKHKKDPTPLLHADHMSDEASGPEDYQNEEEVNEWKKDMANRLGLTNLTPKGLEQLAVFEVIIPDWRSEYTSDIFHELNDTHWKSLKLKDKQRFHQRVLDSTRSSGINDLPMMSPYNCMINVEWYERHVNNVELREMLGDWFDHADPEGWGQPVVEE
ncbi:hypothetical protein EWM64_g8882 [Hericium alpestre]|uniref:Uncharacterized protein n=1 Tax=Hericium alpestre TaxID=135208 RepID=A0A4Y9ZNM9_9AGAM|nr:hypothetical protein EWM64_g8882 [Hericium alpestre]